LDHPQIKPMKTLRRYSVPTLALLSLSAQGQEQTATPTPGYQKQTVASRAVTLPKAHGGRMIFEQIPPPVRAAAAVPAPVPAAPALTPEQLDTRRAAWAAKAPLHTLILIVTATVYPDGVTHLAWRSKNMAGIWSDMEAWTRTDYSSLHVFSGFEIDRTRYCVFANVIDGTLRYAGKRTVPAPGSLPADGALVLLKGDPSDTASLAPVLALHEQYIMDAPKLAIAWKARLAAAREEEGRRRLASQHDTVIRFYAIPDEPAPAKPNSATQPSTPAAQ
jgi:hypothetical protein